MHQDVCKILRCFVDVSVDVVASNDEIVTLTCDCCNVCIDGCYYSSGWLTTVDRLVSLSILFVECSQCFLMSSDAVLSVVPSAMDVLENDRVDFVECCVKVGQECNVVELEKASDL